MSCTIKRHKRFNLVYPSQSPLNNEKAAIQDKEVNTDNTVKPENGDRENSPGQMEIYWDSVNEPKRSSFPLF